MSPALWTILFTLVLGGAFLLLQPWLARRRAHGALSTLSAPYGWDDFWRWFAQKERELRDLGDEDLAIAMMAELFKVEHRIEIHVQLADEPGRPREVVFTANGDATLFADVKALVQAAPTLPGWTFHALQPPGGFDFTFEVEPGKEIDAESLRFAAFTIPGQPGALGVRVFVPADVAVRLEAGREVGSIVAIGVGEEAAARVARIEPASLAEAPREARPMAELAGVIASRWAERPKA